MQASRQGRQEARREELQLEDTLVCCRFTSQFSPLLTRAEKPSSRSARRSLLIRARRLYCDQWTFAAHRILLKWHVALISVDCLRGRKTWTVPLCRTPRVSSHNCLLWRMWQRLFGRQLRTRRFTYDECIAPHAGRRILAIGMASKRRLKAYLTDHSRPSQRESFAILFCLHHLFAFRYAKSWTMRVLRALIAGTSAALVVFLGRHASAKHSALQASAQVRGSLGSRLEKKGVSNLSFTHRSLLSPPHVRCENARGTDVPPPMQGEALRTSRVVGGVHVGGVRSFASSKSFLESYRSNASSSQRRAICSICRIFSIALNLCQSGPLPF